MARDPVWLPSHGEQVSQPGGDVVWRVKVIRMTERELIVEAPGAFGETIILRPGLDLIGAMTIGQNRWMFHTRTLTDRPMLPARSGAPGYLALAMPTNVERCTRRHFYRISTAKLNLPDVKCWSLLDPSSVVAAEAANRVRLNEAMDRRMRIDSASDAVATNTEAAAGSILLPDVGPSFSGKLVNIRGGGLGIRVEPEEVAAAQHRPFVWMLVDLAPALPAPLALTVRAVHTHLDSTQSLYMGLSFDFAFNPDHRQFIVEQFQNYMDKLQARRPTAHAG